MGNRLGLQFKDANTNIDIPQYNISHTGLVGFSKNSSSSQYLFILTYEYSTVAKVEVMIYKTPVESVKLIGGYNFSADYTQIALDKGITIELIDNSIKLNGTVAQWKALGDLASNDAVSMFRVQINRGGYTGSSNSNITKNLFKCTSNLGETVAEGQQTIILNADINYSFSGEIPFISMGSEDYPFTLNEDKTVATIDINIVGDITIKGFAKWIQKVKLTGTFENCICNYVDGEVYDPNKKIQIMATSGFVFKGTYNYTVAGGGSQLKNNGNVLIIETIIYTDDNILLFDNYKATIKTISLGGFINLYLTDDVELKLLSNARFYDNTGEIVDYGKYIYNLFILPFGLPTDLIGTSSNIILGSYDSKVNSTSIINYEYDFNLGEIQVPLKYDNMYDFLNVECFIHLPYTNKVWVGNEYVIGQTVSIIGTIDLYNNTITYNIVSTFNNEIIVTLSTELGKTIPFIQRGMGNNNVINNIQNNIKRCFIEVNRNIPYTKEKNIFGGSVVEYGKIGDYTGYLECENLILETGATNQEQEEIKSILNSGVFI